MSFGTSTARDVVMGLGLLGLGLAACGDRTTGRIVTDQGTSGCTTCPDASSDAIGGVGGLGDDSGPPGCRRNVDCSSCNGCVETCFCTGHLLSYCEQSCASSGGTGGSAGSGGAAGAAGLAGAGGEPPLVSSSEIVGGPPAAAVAIGDVTGDGHRDVITVDRSASAIHLFVHLPATARLAAPVTYGTSQPLSRRSIVVANLDDDGLMDVALAFDAGVGALYHDTAGKFAAAFTVHPTSPVPPSLVASGDLDDDGRADVAALSFSSTVGGALDVLFGGTAGLGPASHHVVPGSGYSDLEIGDVTGDGRDDAVISGNSFDSELTVLVQQPGGGFVAQSLALPGPPSTSVAIADVSGDGLNDVLVTTGGNSASSSLKVLTQNAGGVLDPAVTHPSQNGATSAATGDLNGDGRVDALVLHAGSSAIGVYLQGGAKHLQAEQLLWSPAGGPEDPGRLAVGDFVSESRPDLALADSVGLVVLDVKP